MARNKKDGENASPTIRVSSHAWLRRAGVSRCSGGASHYPPSQGSHKPNTPKSVSFLPKWYAGATDSRIPPPWEAIYIPIAMVGFSSHVGAAPALRCMRMQLRRHGWVAQYLHLLRHQFSLSPQLSRGDRNGWANAASQSEAARRIYNRKIYGAGWREVSILTTSDAVTNCGRRRGF